MKREQNIYRTRNSRLLCEFVGKKKGNERTENILIKQRII